MTLALVAIQFGTDLGARRDPAGFAAEVDRCAALAAEACQGATHRLFVFPEHIGLVAATAVAPAAAAAVNVDQAVARFALTRPLAMLGAMWEHRTAHPRQAMLFALAEPIQALMRKSFAVIARRYRATVVAGSFPRRRGDGSLMNSSHTFAPSGRLLATTEKVNLTPKCEDASAAGLGLSRGRAEQIPVVPAEWGRLATLIGCDVCRHAEDPAHRFSSVVDWVDTAGPDVIANPRSWRLNRGVDDGLTAMLAASRSGRAGVTAQLVGGFGEYTFSGTSFVVGRSGAGVEVLAQARADHPGEVVCAQVELPAAVAAGAAWR